MFLEFYILALTICLIICLINIKYFFEKMDSITNQNISQKIQLTKINSDFIFIQDRLRFLENFHREYNFPKDIQDLLRDTKDKFGINIPEKTIKPSVKDMVFMILNNSKPIFSPDFLTNLIKVKNESEKTGVYLKEKAYLYDSKDMLKYRFKLESELLKLLYHKDKKEYFKNIPILPLSTNHFHALSFNLLNFLGEKNKQWFMNYEWKEYFSGSNEQFYNKILEIVSECQNRLFNDLLL